MLTIRKLEYDVLGNVSITLKHRGYTIRILTCVEPANKHYIIERLGVILNVLSQHPEYSRAKSFTNRIYKIKQYGINYNWFVRAKNTTDKQILDILTGNPQKYNVNVTVIKYSIGLANNCSTDMALSRVYTTDTKAALIGLINEVIKRTFEDARNIEPTIFGSGSLWLHTRNCEF